MLSLNHPLLRNNHFVHSGSREEGDLKGDLHTIRTNTSPAQPKKLLSNLYRKHPFMRQDIRDSSIPVPGHEVGLPEYARDVGGAFFIHRCRSDGSLVTEKPIHDRLLHLRGYSPLRTSLSFSLKIFLIVCIEVLGFEGLSVALRALRFVVSY